MCERIGRELAHRLEKALQDLKASVDQLTEAVYWAAERRGRRVITTTGNPGGGTTLPDR